MRCIVLFLTTISLVHGFVPAPTTIPRDTTLKVSSTGDENNFLLSEFKTANGEIVNPYRVLKVSRSAERKEIRNAYRALSRRYHPDGAMHRDILPGSWYVLLYYFKAFVMLWLFCLCCILTMFCISSVWILNSNSDDDIRDEWERIKLSYEILSHKKTRMRYDRHSLLSDPGAAAQRAVLGAVGWGLKGVGEGLFQVGAGAWNAVAGKDKDDNNGYSQDDEA